MEIRNTLGPSGPFSFLPRTSNLPSPDIDAGGWLQTFTGRRFYPFNPRAASVSIVDIAHALAYQCRFSGHVKDFYSVAQHSVWVSYVVSAEAAKWGLLHDAAEAYLVDLPTPLKLMPEFSPYRRVENLVSNAIAERYGLPSKIPTEVHDADRALLATEARDLLLVPPKWALPEPLCVRIEPLAPEDAEFLFLERFNDLFTDG